MDDLVLLDKLIKDTAKVSLETNFGKNEVTLVEQTINNCSVTIRGIPSDTVVIKVDKFKSPDSIFNCDNGECKRADFIIVSGSDQKKVILYIEMKKNKGSSRAEIVQQLKGAKCFLIYAQEIEKHFLNEKNFLTEYNHRFISIGHISISKRKTRITKETASHDEPDTFMKIDWPHTLQFNKLAGK